ncbi:MAG: hypothetical protein A3F73_08710 [Gallionellales bacterium RIFCSPLOWO2_12_FULL_59_22]|nr:MAG: hypothetical protein A3H99_09775 [Gallionellales bacterium RIFCSPLOWO2_02_FULL_59_110]OGT05293.1 MAG: hypothetical protein A2Z65_13485 [Gallionellales bacterium RIFCSPLOWO2_02_58_13]OGT12890.1 MAG: hypothetical protein A3F73_08710 [Gallionellales bacterium RIFCSPLOWO2_12_FULL_59_22]
MLIAPYAPAFLCVLIIDLRWQRFAFSVSAQNKAINKHMPIPQKNIPLGLRNKYLKTFRVRLVPSS